MDLCFLKGLIVFLLILHCKSEGISTSYLPSIETPRDGSSIPAPAPVPAPALPLAPPSLKEVEQAVQQASERQRTEEVLKELLERVVEAALMEARGDTGEKVREALAETEPVVGVVEEQAPDEVEVLGGAQRGHGGGGEVQEVEEEVDGEPEVVAGTAVEAEGIVGGEVAGEHVGKVLAGEDVGGIQEDEAATGVSPSEVEVREEEAGGGTLKAQEEQEAAGKPEEKQPVLSEEAGVSDTSQMEANHNVKPGVGGGAVVQPLEQGGGDQAAVEAVVGGGEEASPLPPVGVGQTVVGEAVEEEEEEEEKGEADIGAHRAEVEEGEGGLELGEAGAGEAGGGVTGPENEAQEVDRLPAKAGGQHYRTAETSVVQEVPMIAAPPGVAMDDGDGVYVEWGPATQTAPPLSPILGGTNLLDGEDLLRGEPHTNEISSSGGRLTYDSAQVTPTWDDLGGEGEATPPFLVQGRAEPGEANGLVEKPAGSSEVRELSLEAWKIGAIFAAAFLVLETVVIIYIVKCHSKTNSTSSASQSACEEGCVEPEAATRRDCGDDTQPADKGNFQQQANAAPPPPDHHHQQGEQGVALVDRPPSSAAEPGPLAPQEGRTSVL